MKRAGIGMATAALGVALLASGPAEAFRGGGGFGGFHRRRLPWWWFWFLAWRRVWRPRLCMAAGAVAGMAAVEIVAAGFSGQMELRRLARRPLEPLGMELWLE